ncbi:MAG: hypothetical protein O7H39_18265 [Gammaproteobacteria bacterium]|nr:hypothetical protein [Gammaproteobacteria bacterium]
MPEHIIHMENGRLAADTPFPVVQQMVVDAVDTGNVVIHFHGGLVNEVLARAIARRLTPTYQQAGAYPLFPVWEAGLFETISNNLGQLSSEELFRTVFKLVRRIVRRKFAQDDGGRGAGAVPGVDVTVEEAALVSAFDANDGSLMPAEPTPDPGLTVLSNTEVLALEMELQQDPELQIAAQAVSNGLRDPADIARDEAMRAAAPVAASSVTLMDPAAVDRLVDRPDPAGRGIFSTIKIVKAVVVVAGRVIRRYVTSRDHGFHATIVEEILREFYLANIGGVIWSQMKGDTKDSFGPDPTRFGGTALLSVLRDKIQSGAHPKVTLVGHSTGAVYIAHLLDSADTMLPAGFTFDIVLLAPASTFDLAADTFVRHQARIGGLRMFTMTDTNEKADRLVPVLYPHSLLYFVSGVVEPDADTPLIGMERFYDRSQYDASDFPQVEAFRQLIDNVPNGAVWSVATGGGAGLETKALSHGDFDNDTKTLESVQEIIRNGF